MKNSITLAFCLIVMSSSFAQHVNYQNDSKWFFGLNVGAAWNTTDVDNKTNVGWGFLFGKSFNANPGRLTSFDLRLRYLRGIWYGQDYDTTSLSNYSPAYMPDNLQEYKDGQGVTVNNFQADVHELGLELALHANRLRERTGWDPYIFGGANIVWNRTKSNLLNSDSAFFDPAGMYDYTSTAVNEAYINSTLDGSYETAMNSGSEGNGWNANFMPSLGIGLGYYFGPRWSFGVEHKTTFALKDDWDGYEDAEPRWGMFENDIYHYTSAYLRFHIRARGNATIPPPDNGNTNNLAPCNNPTVRFIRPANNGTTVDQQVYAMRARVDGVGGRDNIVVRVNGVETSNYFYNENTNELEANIVLSDGPNTIQIVATNGCGSTVKDMSVEYRGCKNPIVKFINPSHDNFNVDKAQYVVRASIANGGTITYTVNGIVSTNFFYNQANGSFESNITLREGINTIQIKVSNGCGTDVQTVKIVYTDCEDPHIDFLIGNGSVMNVTTSSVTIKAHVYGVDNRNGIGLRVNGANRAFIFNASTHLFESQLNLVPGQNVIKITAGNNCGTATETITVNYTPCVDPTVNIISPAAQSSVNTTGTAPIKATVTNITSANQIQMFVNGVAVAGGSYNVSTHIFTGNAPLNAGLNTIQVVVTNDCGTDSETVTIRYNAPCPQPVATAVTNVTQVNNPNFQIQAVIQNITSAGQVQMTLNGVPVAGGTYNNNTHVFTGNVLLQSGNNTIIITATNNCGFDNLTYNVNYSEPCDLPVLTMINPVSQPITTATPVMNIQASVLNITNTGQVHLTVNGVGDASGGYNGSTHVYQNSVNLQTGNNVIVLSVTNACGTVSETINVQYAPCLEPAVAITSPSGGVTQNGNAIVQASIQNVSNANQIQLLVNGGTVTGSFNAGTGLFQSNVALSQGQNVIQIIATNNCGTTTEMTTITYQPCLAPTVAITSPTVQTTQNDHVLVQATIPNVSGTGQIQMTVNGSAVSGTYNNTTHVFGSNVALTSGNNVITITATNDCGSDTKTIAIRYDEPCNMPVVNITAPTPGAPIMTNSVQVKATVTNVTSANQIQLVVNGSTVSGGTYNPTTHLFQATVTLQDGMNSIVVTATNDCGADSESVAVRKKVRGEEEKIVICHHPPGNPENTQQIEIPLSAWPAHEAHGDTQGPCPEEPVDEEETMIICHHPPGNPENTQQLEIPVSAWAAHQAHGDTEGPCVEMPNDPTDPTDRGKIVICHHPPGSPDNTQQIEIPLSAWPAHEAHGDTQGPCPNGGNNGNGGQNGTGSINNNGNTGNQGGNASGGGTVGTQTIGNAGGGSGTINIDNGTGTQGNDGSGGGSLGTGTIGNAPGGGNISNPDNGSQGGGTGGGNREGQGDQGKEKSDRIKAQEEAKRKAAEEAARKKAEEEAKRKAAEEAARKKAEEEAKRKAAQEAARKKAEEEAKRKAAEEAARKKAEEEVKRKAAEEAARKKSEEEAKRKAAQEAARKKAEEEAKRKAAEEEARKKAEEEAKRKAAEEAARKKAAEEAAKKKAKEAAGKKVEEEEEKEEGESEEEEEKEEGGGKIKGERGGGR